MCRVLVWPELLWPYVIGIWKQTPGWSSKVQEVRHRSSLDIAESWAGSGRLAESCSCARPNVSSKSR
jgi:hypothetical protein